MSGRILNCGITVDTQRNPDNRTVPLNCTAILIHLLIHHGWGYVGLRLSQHVLISLLYWRPCFAYVSMTVPVVLSQFTEFTEAVNDNIDGISKHYLNYNFLLSKLCVWDLKLFKVVQFLQHSANYSTCQLPYFQTKTF